MKKPATQKTRRKPKSPHRAEHVKLPEGGFMIIDRFPPNHGKSLPVDWLTDPKPKLAKEGP